MTIGCLKTMKLVLVGYGMYLDRLNNLRTAEIEN